MYDISDFTAVLEAVVKCAPHEWYSIGLKIGFTDGQITDMTDGLRTSAAKIEKVVNVKAADIGEQEATELLLEACERISNPVIGAVRMKLQQSHHPDNQA